METIDVNAVLLFFVVIIALISAVVIPLTFSVSKTLEKEDREKEQHLK